MAGPDYETFQEIPCEVMKAEKENINLYVTPDLIAVEFRPLRYYVSCFVFNRRTLELVYKKDDVCGHFHVGILSEERQLIFKEHNRKVMTEFGSLVKILPNGGEEKIWTGRTYCGCDPNRQPFSCNVFITEHAVTEFCYACSGVCVTDLRVDPNESLEYTPKWPPVVPRANIEITDTDIIALVATNQADETILGVHFLEVGMDTPLAMLVERGYKDMCFCASDDYLVVSWRDFLSPSKHVQFHVRYRWAESMMEFEAPAIMDNIKSMKIFSESTLLLLPDGSTPRGMGIENENVYTMDLTSEDPGETVMSFKVPISEVRVIGNRKIICKTDDLDQDIFQVYELPFEKYQM